MSVRVGEHAWLTKNDRSRPRYREDAPWADDTPGAHHRAIHRGRHLYRMRHSRFPFPGRAVDQEPADPVRRIPRQPGGAQRILAPGRGHRALASLYRAGKVPAVVTQNIDNLHQASGIAVEHVVELHGNTSYATCLDCASRYELNWVRERMEAANGCAPDCPDCGGFVKTATISFGQAMPEDAMRRAQELALSCNLFLAIGSSLVVWPAAGFPLMAKRNGAQLVIINREPTEFDEMADLVVRQDIGTVLEPFIVH
jgi:NAD-dependent SIR2 family protein deacetylase